MIAQRTFSRLVAASGLALVVAGMVWLMFGLAGDRTGMHEFAGSGPVLEQLPDRGAKLSLNEVISMSEADWERWDGSSYIRAGHGDAVWMRATLPNPTNETLHGIVADSEYFPDHVQAWVRLDTGEWRTMHSGEALRGRDKAMWGRTAAFPVSVPAGGERVIYLRAEDYYFVYLRPHWWPGAEDYYAAQMRDMMAETICYGGLLALVIYNLILWARLRFSDTGCYVLYAAGATIFNLMSNGAPALFGIAMGSPWKEMTVTGALSLSGVFLLQFGRIFLGTESSMPRADHLLRWLRGGLFVITLGVPAMPWMSGLQWLSATVIALAIVHAVLLTVAVIAWRGGAEHARFFVAAFGILFAGGMPAVATWLNQDILAGAARGLLAGSLLEMIMLSFAVADRFARTQQLLIEETEQRYAIEEAYADELETEVSERTREFEHANADKDRILDIIGHDLRSPLTGLMRSANAAQGDFPRETAGTARALLLMIEDLVLWARLRAGSHRIAEHPLHRLLAPAVALHRSLAEHGGIDLQLEIPEELQVETDLVLAQTLIRNLLANALKFADTRVVLGAEKDGAGCIRFTVGNDGAPLSETVAARLASGESEPITATGGLGLRLCRDICRALGMHLTARRGETGGTEFKFTLRAATDKAP